MKWYIAGLVVLLVSLSGSLAVQCGNQAGGALCPGRLCCSPWGWCGGTYAHCGAGCQSQCHGGGGGDRGVRSLISREMFEKMLRHRDKGFYTYDAFIEATQDFPEFGNTGDNVTRFREIAAFFGQTSHETASLAIPPIWSDPGFEWGYYYVRQPIPFHPWLMSDYCAPDRLYPCAPGQKYYGRGPMQIKWNFNYGECGRNLSLELLNNPDLVATDPVISFKTALWVWMTPRYPKPSCHSVMTGGWEPSGEDLIANRFPGYGMTTNILNGGDECGRGENKKGKSRIGFYKRYCDMLGIYIDYNLDCYDQTPYDPTQKIESM